MYFMLIANFFNNCNIGLMCHIYLGTGTATPAQQLLKPQPPQPLPDMQPFFVKEYVKSKY